MAALATLAGMQSRKISIGSIILDTASRLLLADGRRIKWVGFVQLRNTSFIYIRTYTGTHAITMTQTRRKFSGGRRKRYARSRKLRRTR